MKNVNNMVLPVFQTVLLITILVLVILNYTKMHKGFQNREGYVNLGSRISYGLTALDDAKKEKKERQNVASNQYLEFNRQQEKQSSMYRKRHNRDKV
jgi:hypothetical protein